jgi:hypothetical protein
MVRQLIAMGTGMGIVPGGREGRFDLRVMGRMRIQMIHGGVMFLLIVAFFVLAGMRPEEGLYPDYNIPALCARWFFRHGYVLLESFTNTSFWSHGSGRETPDYTQVSVQAHPNRVYHSARHFPSDYGNSAP